MGNETTDAIGNAARTRRQVLKRGALASGAIVGMGPVSGSAAAHDHSCPRTPGFWLDPDRWPERVAARRPVVDNLAGRPVETPAQVVRILGTPPRGDVSLVLARHLLVAKLNLIAGSASGCIRETRVSANNWLYTVDFWANFTGDGAQRSWTINGVDGESLKDRLDDYNNQRLAPECGCRSSGRDDDDEEDGPPGHRGPDDDEEDDDGPPGHRGPDDDDDEEDDGGPPGHRGPDDDDDEENDDRPPGHRGPDDDDGDGPPPSCPPRDSDDGDWD